MIGVSKRTIINYEKGTSSPQDHEIYANLASALECDENYIKTENENFITTAFAQYDKRETVQVQQILDQTSACLPGVVYRMKTKWHFFMKSSACTLILKCVPRNLPQTDTRKTTPSNQSL